MVNENSREYRLAKTIEDAVNTFGFDRSRFTDGILSMHRTNQQSMFRHIIVPVIRLMGQPGFGVDDRNRAAHRLATRLLEVIEADGAYLPMV